MATSKITELSAIDSLSLTDIFPVVDDPSGTPVTKKSTFQKLADFLASLSQTLTNKTLVSPTITPDPSVYRGHKVYCFGDSLTYGTGSGDRNYPQKLQDLLGYTYEIVNEGVAGNTTAQLLARLNTDILDNDDAEFVVVWGGINDIYQDISVTTTEANLQAIYTAISDAGAKVISINISPTKSNVDWTAARQTAIDALNAWISGVATDIDYKVDAYALLEDPATPDTLLASYDSGDGLHLSQTGYYEVATKVYTQTMPYWAASSTNKVSDLFKVDGWTPFVDALAYETSNQIFSDQQDIRDLIQNGDKIKFLQTDGIPKYFYISGVPTYSGGNVHIPLYGGTDYTVANAYIREAYYSKADNPQSFPHWFTWLPVLSGAGGSIGTHAITVTYASARIVGKTGSQVNQ